MADASRGASSRRGVCDQEDAPCPSGLRRGEGRGQHLPNRKKSRETKRFAEFYFKLLLLQNLRLTVKFRVVVVEAPLSHTGVRDASRVRLQ